MGGSGCKLPSEKDLEVSEEARGEQRTQGSGHAVREASGERVAVTTGRFVDCPRRGSPGDNWKGSIAELRARLFLPAVSKTLHVLVGNGGGL